MRRRRDSASNLALEIRRGAFVLAPDGRDVTNSVRASFNRLLPTCGGDWGAAATRAVRAALVEQREGRQ